VYDIDYLVKLYQPDDAMRANVLRALTIKSDDRDLEIGPDSFENPEVSDRARAEWESMRMEIGGLLPPFDEAFARVAAFYKALPWPA